MTAVSRRTTRAAAGDRHEGGSSDRDGVKIGSAQSANGGPATSIAQSASPVTMASTRKGKGSNGNGNGYGRQAVVPLSSAGSDVTTTASTPSSDGHTSTAATSSASSTTRSARSSRSTRHTQPENSENGNNDKEATIKQFHTVPDNVMHAQGLSSISTALIDGLPERAFPKKGIKLHPQDMADSLLILCGKVLASVSNRALTPKEIALVLARRHGWQFSGSQPFAVVSSCIRSHVRRAGLANPPYPPIFTPYELSSVPPNEDIPCLGIEADSKPVVKRGTFWYLSDSMGYGYPFPHRRAEGIAAASPSILSTASSLPSSNIATPTHQTASLNQQQQHRRSSSRHQPAQPIPIMPAPQSINPSTTSLPTLAPKGGSTDRLTRAQRSAQNTASTHLVEDSMMAQSAPPLPSALTNNGKFNNGKRKRTISKAVLSQEPMSMDGTTHTYPHLQQQAFDDGASANQLNGSTHSVTFASSNAVGQKAAASSRGSSSAAHRRAFSSSAGDGVSAKPIPALRKLKLRLSSVSESAVLDSPGSISLPAKKVTLKGSTSTSSTKQPKSKRARTQSMSHHTNTTASFPFDDLHLYHSMQGQNQLPSSLHNPPSFSAEGTLFPFEMHMQHPSASMNAGIDLLTSRSAPEGNVFFPNPNQTLQQQQQLQAQGIIAGPFSRSHSPSSSSFSSPATHHYRSGRRSLPPEYENDEEDEGESGLNSTRDELEYDGWGMDSDHLLLSGDVSSLSLMRGGTKDRRNAKGDGGEEEDSFHEAMLKNDDIDFAFDFSLGSLGESASRGSRVFADESNLSLEEEEDQVEVEDGDDNDTAIEDGDEEFNRRRDSRRSTSALLDPSSDTFGVDGVFDGLDLVDEPAALVNNKKSKRPSLKNRRKSSANSEDVDMTNQEGASEHEEDVDEAESQDQDEEEDDDDSPSSRVALLDKKAFEKALNTTLCPAAAKFGDGSTKPARLLAKRMNSASSLTFTRHIPSIRTSEAPHNADVSSSSSPINTSNNTTITSTSLLRPASVKRTNLKDVLSTAVPLAELPSIPLENNRRDSFLFYHLTSDADPPSDYGYSFKSSPRMEGKENSDAAERDDLIDDAASSSSASSGSSLLTRIVKSEEELDEMVDMQGEELDTEETHHRNASRCCSTASAISRAEVESNDSFNPEMIYPIGRRAPSADLGNIGGQGELDEVSQSHALRSQSSSRTTSMSPRDSFSPRMVHHGGSYSSEVEADWALTPPSEEEHVDEDEKNLDRATMLGLESVGMDDLDDVWPGVRRSLGGNGPSTHAGAGNIEAQVDGVTSEFRGMEVFEPVLSAAPIPHVDIPSPILFSLSTINGKNLDGEDTSDNTVMMEIDQTPMDEHAAAAMFIADESLHPPKPAPIDTSIAAASNENLNTPQPSLSPVSAATRDATNAADEYTPTTSAVNVLQQNSAAACTATDRDSTTPVQQTQSELAPQPASTQSFLFHPEKPFHPEISILLTDTKILFYSTMVNVASNDGRPLLRRVDNDAVDGEALLLSLEGASDSDADRLDSLKKIKGLGNTWVSLDFARQLLKKHGGVDPLLGIFLADDILLAWNEKLVKLGSMLRQKNGLATPVSAGKASTDKTKAVKAEKISTSSSSSSVSPKVAEKAILPKKSVKAASAKIEESIRSESKPVPIKSKREVEVAPLPSSSPPKKDKVGTPKTNLARRASSRIKPAS